MWSVYLLSLLVVCTAVPINRDFSTIYVDRSNEKFGNESVCVSDDVLYKEGDSMATTNVCERCTCRPPRFVCQDIVCEVKPGCRVVQRPNTCCPEYQCECERDGKFYQNGERLDDVDSPCQACYCQSGEIVCTVIECYRRDDCEPRYVNGTCCPKYDHCPPLEPTPVTLHTSTSKQQENDLQNTSQENLQDNAVDSSKRIDILGAIMSDSAYLAPASYQQYEGDLSDDAEILEENMSEVHTERTTVNLQADQTTEDETHLEDTSVQDDETTSVSGDHEDNTSKTSLEETLQDNGDAESETVKSTETDHEVKILDVKETLLETTTVSAEETTDLPDTMLGDGGPSWYIGEIKHVNSDKSQPTSNEETSKELSTSKEDEATTNIPKYKESEENSSESESSEDESKEESEPTTSTTVPAEDYEIPVLTIKSDVSAENMSIVIPQLIRSNTGYEEGSSMVQDDPDANSSSENKSPVNSDESEEDSKEVTTEEVKITNKNEEKSNTDDSAEKDSSEEDSQSEMTIPEDKSSETTTTSDLETKNSNGSEETEDSSETTETEEISTSSQFSIDNTIKRETESETTTEVTETTDDKVLVLSTTPNVLEGEHPENRRSDVSESESTTVVTEETNIDEIPSTTPNVLEGEHLGLKKSDTAQTETTSEITETTNSEEISTTPNVLEGEHPENRRSGESDETETTDTTGSDETLSTTPNVLEGEHPENRRSGESDESSTETRSDDDVSTTPNFLEGEHPNSKLDDETPSEISSDDSQVKELASGELSESFDESTETELSTENISESKESSQHTTPTEETTTYSSIETTTTDEEDSSVKILPPVPLINRTLSGELTSDKIEALPEKWLKLEGINETKTADHQLISQEEIESNSAETTTEIPTSTSTVEYDEYSGSIHKSPEEHKTSDEEITPTSSTGTEGKNGEEVTTTSAETEIPTKELYQWSDSDEKSELIELERHTLLSREETIGIKPIYVDNYGSLGSNEQMFSTAEIYTDYYVPSKENHKTSESNEVSTHTEAEDVSQETTSTEVSPTPNSKEDSNTQTEEVYSNEYIDSSSKETTTVSSNITETTTNKNDTETTTLRSFDDSNYNEIDASKKMYPSWETLNSQNEETYDSTNTKEVHDSGNYFDDSSLVME